VTAADGLARRAEEALGDPWGGGVGSYAAAVDLDRTSRFPTAGAELLDDLGFSAQYVPRRFGGDLVDVAAAAAGVRAVARRDLTLAIGHAKTFLGAVSAWIADEELARDVVAPMVLSGAPVSWGLTERGRGSDLAATATRAELHHGGGVRLTGEKWLINNATRGRAVTLLVRTSDEAGPRATSLVFCDKTELSGSWATLPKIATHGIRGADISGIRFDRAGVPSGRVIGAPGTGLETVLKGLQVTRTLCTALALGAGDAALDHALCFTSERVLYGRRLDTLPAARRDLVTSAADLVIAESASVAGARHVQLLPAELPFVGAAVKHVVPSFVEPAVDRLARLLGANALRTEGRYAAVQKIVRDDRVVSVFDGTTAVSLHAVVNEFPSLVRGRPLDDGGTIALAARLVSPAPIDVEWDPARQRLVSPRGSTLLRALPTLADRVVGRSDDAVEIGLIRRVLRCWAAVRTDLAAVRVARHPEPAVFALADRVTVAFAAAAFLARLDVARADGDDRLDRWAVPCLARIAGRLGEAAAIDRSHRDHAFDALRRIR
jgi:alkylation response protein AidB-like acyl-CoA dehydrogenase